MCVFQESVFLINIPRNVVLIAHTWNLHWWHYCITEL